MKQRHPSSCQPTAALVLMGAFREIQKLHSPHWLPLRPTMSYSVPVCAHTWPACVRLRMAGVHSWWHVDHVSPAPASGAQWREGARMTLVTAP